jgi:hypothetical protein
MTMQYVRDTYGVPCKRGVYVRMWRELRPAQQDAPRWQADEPYRITGATHHVHAGWHRYHPWHNLEYLDSDGFRLWPVTDADFARACIPLKGGPLMAPVRP